MLGNQLFSRYKSNFRVALIAGTGEASRCHQAPTLLVWGFILKAEKRQFGFELETPTFSMACSDLIINAIISYWK